MTGSGQASARTSGRDRISGRDRPSPRRPLLNVASICLDTGSLGPGRRSVAWVQGCALSCPGCLAPEWIPQIPATEHVPADLASLLLGPDRVTGLTFSGGEPMLQASGLAEVARVARRHRDVSVVCFTGYTLERLLSCPPSTGVADLLAEVDVLIDGPYLAERDDGVGLRGSANQRVHYLTGRISPQEYDFGARVRTVEVRVTGRGTDVQVMVVGIPPHGVRERLAVVRQRVEELAGGPG